MRKFISGLLFAIALAALLFLAFSCKGGSKEKLLVPREEAMVAALYVLPNGQKDQSPLLRVTLRRDSSGKILTEIIWARRVVSPVLDSVSKKPALDSLGYLKTKSYWQVVGKDSIFTDLTNRNLDSLATALWPVKQTAAIGNQ